MIAKFVRILFFAAIFFPYVVSGYNPCNEVLFWECDDHDETWHGVTKSKTTNCLCPPYNKTDRGGCLKQFNLAEPFNAMFNRYCAETSDRTDFFDPTIRVRVQTCNIACWELTEHLRGDGECAIFPGFIGIPLLRLCARIALPADPKLPAPADHGYTYGWHIDYEGAPEVDPIYQGVDGKPVFMARPKVCAYWDPSVWDAIANWAAAIFGGSFFKAATDATIRLALAGVASSTLSNSSDSKAGATPSDLIREFIKATGIEDENLKKQTNGGGGEGGMIEQTGGTGVDVLDNMLGNMQAMLQPDLWDLNPIKQGVHYHQGGQSIIVTMLLSILKMGFGMADMMVQMTSKIGPGVQYILYVIMGMFSFLFLIMYIGQEIIIPVLEYLGQINNVVGASLGCALIPLGPFPPPYCDPMVPPLQPVIISQICPTVVVGTTLTTLAPSSTNQCVNSSVTNNIINNSVRVGINELLPLCGRGQDSGDTCVTINMPGATLAKSLHVMTNNLDVLKVCSAIPAPANEIPCVESPTLITKCKNNNVWCNKGVRIAYATSAGGITFINNYFDSEATDCTQVQSVFCQKVWGVNIGDFADLTVSFPVVESSYTTASQTSTTAAVLSATDGTRVSVTASIPRKTITLQAGGTIDATKICAFDSFNLLIGCVARPIPPKPTVYECKAPGTLATCDSSHFDPFMIAKIQVGTYHTEGALSTLTSKGKGSKINLAGFDYDSFVTDETFAAKPFKGNHSINPSSIFGQYKDDQGPYNPDGSENLDAIYIKGLEYQNNKYIMGGQSMCLAGYKFDDCLTGKTNVNCILTSLINSDFVRCVKFYNDVVIRYPGINLCSATQLASGSGYTRNTVLSEPVASGSGSRDITIYSSTPNGPHCYTYTGADTKGELCKIGNDANSRVSPAPSFGSILLDNNYYPYNKTMSINGDVLAVRNKNVVEMGLCVDVPSPPSCKAIDQTNGNNEVNGFASWAVAQAGEKSIGKCVGSGISATPLERYCIVDKKTGLSALEPLPAGMGCKVGCGYTTPYNLGNTIDANGNFHLGKMYRDHPDGWYVGDYGAYDGGANGKMFKSYYYFTIKDVSNITNFKLPSLSFEDWLLVKVNGNNVYSGYRSDMETLILSKSNNKVQISEADTGTYYNPNLGSTTKWNGNGKDLRPYLRNGVNLIETNLVVANGGGIYINFDYANPDCPKYIADPVQTCMFTDGVANSSTCSQPTCLPIGEKEGNSAANGFASWSATWPAVPTSPPASVDSSVGQCLPGYMLAPNSPPLKRACNINNTTHVGTLEALPDGMGCIPIKKCAFSLPSIYNGNGSAISAYDNDDGAITSTSVTDKSIGFYSSMIDNAYTMDYKMSFTYQKASLDPTPPSINLSIAFGPDNSSGYVMYNGVKVETFAPPLSGWGGRKNTNGLWCYHCPDHEAMSEATKTIYLAEPMNGINEVILRVVTPGPSYLGFQLNFSCPP